MEKDSSLISSGRSLIYIFFKYLRIKYHILVNKERNKIKMFFNRAQVGRQMPHASAPASG